MPDGLYQCRSWKRVHMKPTTINMPTFMLSERTQELLRLEIADGLQTFDDISQVRGSIFGLVDDLIRDMIQIGGTDSSTSVGGILGREPIGSVRPSTGRNFSNVFMFGQRSLLTAVQAGNIETIRRLLPIYENDVNETNVNGQTALHIASGKGDPAVVGMMLGISYIDVNKTDRLGRTPLRIAVEYGQVEVVRLLLKSQNVDANRSDVYRYTPLHIAARTGQAEVVYLLLGNSNVDV
eukprot:936431_1